VPGYFAKADDDEDINGSTLLVERVKREGQEFGDALAQLVHSDGLFDGKGGDVIVDLEDFEMKGMGSRRVTDKNRIKVIPGRPVNHTSVSNDVVSLAALSMRATLSDEVVSLSRTVLRIFGFKNPNESF